MNILGAIIAGLAGTVVLTMMMRMGPSMGMPKMDMVGILGAMFSKESNRGLGLAMHMMMGAVFGVVYALLWSSGIGSVGIVSGLIFGIVHWLIVGAMMGGMPMMHVGMKAGSIAVPGVYMTNKGGAKSFMGGMMGHILFGITTAIVYGLFV